MAATALLGAGDTVRFKGGVVYSGNIVIKRSGQSGAPLGFDGNSTGDWGAGRAVIDLNCTLGTAVELAANVGNITFRSFEIRNVGGYRDDDPILVTSCIDNPITAPPGGLGINIANGGNTNVLVEQVYFNRIGQWRNTPPFSGVNSVTGAGVSIQNANSIVVRDCEFTKMRTGISIKSTTTTQNVEVDNCDIHDYICWGVDVAPRRTGATLSNVSIHDCLVHDYHQFDSGNWMGCGEKPHTDGIFLRTSGISSIWSQIKVYNCSFYADRPGNSNGGTASVYVSQGPSVMIFNNTFRSDSHTRAIGIGGNNPSTMAKQIVKIYNNSFYNSAMPILLDGEKYTSRRELSIVNNAFVRRGRNNMVMVNRASGVFPRYLNYNFYYDPDFSVNDRYVFNDGTYRRFPDLVALGFEAFGQYQDPGYIDVTSVVPSERNLGLSVGGGAVRAGYNLSSYFGFDKNGFPRPSTGPWDIGAYTYQVDSIQSAPTGLQITTTQ